MEQRAAASAAPDMFGVAPDTPLDGASRERAARVQQPEGTGVTGVHQTRRPERLQSGWSSP